MKIITVSREFGSGGREVGKRLADELGIAYYDREIITKIAENSSLDEQYIENVLNRGIVRDFPITFSHSFAIIPTFKSNVSTLLAEQNKVIRSLAEGGDCVIVGRNADTILAEMNPFKLFIYADMDSKVKRCRERASEDEKLTDRELIKKIRQIDKARAETHDIIAATSWGAKEGYHLCVNTTGIEIKQIIPQIAAYSEHWFEQNHI